MPERTWVDVLVDALLLVAGLAIGVWSMLELILAEAPHG
jgi:hypothetical protein